MDISRRSPSRSSSPVSLRAAWKLPDGRIDVRGNSKGAHYADDVVAARRDAHPHGGHSAPAGICASSGGGQTLAELLTVNGRCWRRPGSLAHGVWLRSDGCNAASLGGSPERHHRRLRRQNNLSGQLKAAFCRRSRDHQLHKIGWHLSWWRRCWCSTGQRKTWLRLALILFLAFVRSFVATERLAILELIVPLIVVAAFTYVGDPRPRIRGFVKLAPVILIPAVVAVFAVFEYSRSWVFYKQQSSGSFVDFALERFAGYYATAYNNGQLALDHLPLDGHVPYVSIQALWDAPGISQLQPLRDSQRWTTS